ncbi:MAG: hypothetical protein QNJ74_21945 [Trichodesmium sp. MO_231.B1]|nr:hypothetical protein [Trichodesmium sp. MO_231.B1]
MVDFVSDEVKIHVDLGFQGLQKEFVNIKIPTKKPKGKELTDQQKQVNREKSRFKRTDKKCGRSWRQLYSFMLTAAGLWNFYLMAA